MKKVESEKVFIFRFKIIKTLERREQHNNKTATLVRKERHRIGIALFGEVVH